MVLIDTTIQRTNNLPLPHLGSSWCGYNHAQHEHQAHTDCDGLDLA